MGSEAKVDYVYQNVLYLVFDVFADRASQYIYLSN